MKHSSMSSTSVKFSRIVLLTTMVAILFGVELVENPKFVETPIATLFKKWTSGPGDLHSTSHDNYPVYAGTFTFPTKVFAHPDIRCDFLIPLKSPNGIPVSTAGDIILLFPWPGRQWLRTDEGAWQWASRYGFTVVTLNFLNHDKAKPDDKDKYYIYPTSGSAIAWAQAHLNILEILGLPISTKVFSWGESAGGSAAQLYSSAFPGRVEGLVAFSGRTFEMKTPYLGPTLLLHTTEDRMDENLELETSMRSAGSSPTHFAYPPNWLDWKPGYGWAHTVGNRARPFATSWICALANMRLKTGKIAPVNEWEQVNGQRLPSRTACSEQWLSMINAPAVTENPTSDVIRVTMRHAGDKPNGTIVWVDNRFGVGAEELSITAQVLSDQGYACVALGGGSAPGREITNALQEAKRFPAPFHLVVIAPPAGDASWSATIQFKTFSVFNPSSSRTSELLALLNGKSGRAVVGSDKPAPTNLGTVTWKVMPPTKNSRTWFIEATKVLLDHLE